MSERTSTSFADYVAAKEANATQERRTQMDAARAHAEVLHTETFGLGRQLAALRNHKRLTQGDLAKATGIGQSEISRIEQGKGNPTQETLTKLGAGLGAVLTFVTEEPDRVVSSYVPGPHPGVVGG